MTSRDEIRKIITAARLYYENYRTQEEVAKELGISRPTVSKLLKRALDEEIVQIKIIDPFASNDELAVELCRRTGLEKAIVVPGQSYTPATMIQRIAQVAAHHLETTLTPDDILGVGWGRTLAATAQAIEPHDLNGLLAVPLIGGFGQIAFAFQVQDISQQISRAFSGRCLQLFAPANVPNKAIKESLLQSDDIRRVTYYWDHLTIAVIGIGTSLFDSEMQVLFLDYLDTFDLNELSKRGAVGDICTHFFDIQGKAIPYQNCEVIAIELEALRSTPRVICVAGGERKAKPILGAIRGGYINQLVTDEAAAHTILELV